MKRTLLAGGIALGGVTWLWFDLQPDQHPVHPGMAAQLAPRSIELARARIAAEPSELDRFLDRQRALVAAAPTDAVQWRVLAETLLERISRAANHCGMKVGQPMFDALPDHVKSDVDEGLAAVLEARRLGDEDPDNARIESALLATQIVHWTSALRLDGQVRRALDAAFARDKNHARAHVALGLRKLLAPRMLGHDPEQALVHLSAAAEVLTLDERPCVMAAMACHLLERHEECVRWLSLAVSRNPNNRYAVEVLRRVRAGEDDAFGRPVQ